MGDFVRVVHSEMGGTTVNYQAEELKLLVTPDKDHRDQAGAAYVFKAVDLRSSSFELAGFPKSPKVREAFNHVAAQLPKRLEVDSLVFSISGDWRFYNRSGQLLDLGHSKIDETLLREAADSISDYWPARDR